MTLRDPDRCRQCGQRRNFPYTSRCSKCNGQSFTSLDNLVEDMMTLIRKLQEEIASEGNK